MRGTPRLSKRGEVRGEVSDVPGILSIDPSLSSMSPPVWYLSYGEAIEASLHGVKRINPKTFEPITLGFSKPRLRVGNWSSKGTLIGELTNWKPGAKLVTVSTRERDTVAVIGEGVNSKTLISRILDVIDESLLVELRVSRLSILVKTTPGNASYVAKLIHDRVLVGGMS